MAGGGPSIKPPPPPPSPTRPVDEEDASALAAQRRSLQAKRRGRASLRIESTAPSSRPTTGIYIP